MQGFRRSLLLAASLLALAPLAPLAHAQGFPTKPIKIVITYAPGGTADVIARTLATSMSELLGQPVVVENKTGAYGSIGTMAVKQAPPDGHTLLVTTITTVALAPMVTKDASFDPVKGLTPIANLAMAPMVLLVHQSVPANDFPGFVTWAKQQAKGVDIASAGPTPQVATALLAQQGKLKVIGVTSAQPSPAVPGAVPLNKFVPGYVQDINFALWAPPGTPADVAAKLTETVRKGLSAPGMAEKFVAFSVPLAVAGPDEVTRITTRESNNFKKVMETVPIKF